MRQDYCNWFALSAPNVAKCYMPSVSLMTSAYVLVGLCLVYHLRRGSLKCLSIWSVRSKKHTNLQWDLATAVDPVSDRISSLIISYNNSSKRTPSAGPHVCCTTPSVRDCRPSSVVFSFQLFVSVFDWFCIWHEKRNEQECSRVSCHEELADGRVLIITDNVNKMLRVSSDKPSMELLENDFYRFSFKIEFQNRQILNHQL